jgi:hypothetical protein
MACFSYTTSERRQFILTKAQRPSPSQFHFRLPQSGLSLKLAIFQNFDPLVSDIRHSAHRMDRQCRFDSVLTLLRNQLFQVHKPPLRRVLSVVVIISIFSD